MEIEMMILAELHKLNNKFDLLAQEVRAMHIRVSQLTGSDIVEYRNTEDETGR